MDSNANLKVTDSIFINNCAAKNINGTSNVIVEHNWMGSTDENNVDISKTEGVNVTNWLFVKIDATAAMTGSANLSLNNVYDHGAISTYEEYALRPITFSLGGVGATASVPEITLDDNGQASYKFRMDNYTVTLTASCGDVVAAKKLEYVIVDDGSFRALNEIIFFSDDGAVIELTHDYVYFDNDTITDGIVIPRKITINGNGHTIDAKGQTRVFMIPEGVSHITINNINFINAKASYGSVIVLSHYSNHFNISNCNFTNNTATDYGGVLDCVGDFCTIENCNFIDNSAVSKAGVIRYYHDTQADIKNSNFINNRVADGSSGGGVIYADTGAVNIDKSVFMNNVANDKQGSVLYTLKSATITNSIFLNNPGLDVIHGGSGVELTNNWFGNTSKDYGLLVNGSVSGVYNQTTLNNWLYLDIKFLGDYAVISLNNAYYKSNSSAGVISDYNLPEITLDLYPVNLSLNTNKVTLDSTGKAIVYYTKIIDDAKLTASNEYVSLTNEVCDFDILQTLINENDEIELGRNFRYGVGDSLADGISINKSVTIDGKGHTIDANHQSRIFKVTSGNVTLKNINLINGYADSGVLFYNGSDEDSLIIDCCQFIDNDCCAVYLYSGHAWILNSQFGNSTSDEGFAIYNGASNELYLSNNTLSTDTAEIFSANGGNIASQVTVTILDNRTVYKHLDENILVYLTFCDDNGNLMKVADFDLLVNGTKINHVYNNATQRYEASFAASEIGSYPVTVSNVRLSNLTMKNGEINIIDISNDFSTLQSLINDCSTDTFKLTGDYIFNPLTDAGLVGGIVIDKSIMIDGAGFTIDAGNQARIFDVKSGTAAIKNITLVNCTDDFGCAIHNGVNATLTLSNLIFESDCLKGRTIDNDGILCLYNNTINAQSGEIRNHGGKILSPCTAIVKAGTTFALGDKAKLAAVITDDNGNLIGDDSHVCFRLNNELVESAYDAATGEYVAEYVFNAVGSIKVDVSCPSINVTDNKGVGITVLKQNAAITAKDASYIINYGGKYSIALKDSNGKAVAGEKVTFTLNGKVIGSATTDAKGSASITLTAKILKTAKAGKKSLVLRLTSGKYDVAAKTVKITVNKEKTKIAANNIAFKKSQKTKKYAMTLKDSKGKALKGVKVALKVKGKTYTAKTNAKGKATFKITKLTKKGKFNATIKFNGNAYYNAATKNVKITVK